MIDVRWEIVRRSCNTGRVLKIVARDIPRYELAREERRGWAQDARLRRSKRWYYDVRVTLPTTDTESKEELRTHG